MVEDKGEDIEVSLPKVQHGEVKFLSPGAFSNPAPDKLKRSLTAIRYTLVSFIALVSASSIPYAQTWTLGLSAAIILCGGIELATGVKPLPEEPTKINNI